MPKHALRKTKWTLSFDPHLKRAVMEEARKNGVYPVNYLERIVRERLNPFGHADIQNVSEYVRDLRKNSRTQGDQEFLREIRAWQKSHS